MKSFLDHFRRKGGDESPDAPRKTSLKDEKGDVVAAGLSTTRKTLSAGDSKVPNGAPDPPPQPREVIKLQLSDFLPRIPPKVLRPGKHDGSIELEFDAEELAESIGRGITTISLLEIYRRVPDIFVSELQASSAEEVRFPWQKVMTLVKTAGSSDSRLSKKTADALAERLQGRKPTTTMTHKEVEAATMPVQERVTSSAEMAGPRGNDSQQRSEPSLTVFPELAGTSPDLRTATPLEPSVVSASSEGEATASEPSAVSGAVGSITEMELPFSSSSIEKPDLAESNVVRARDRAPARLKGEHERQLAAESAAKASGERRALQDELHEKARATEELQAQLDALKQASDQQVAALIQERDALLQQKEHLTKQAAQFRGAKSHVTTEPAAGEALSGPERSKKEYQRQIGELQRRIAAFENNQKEAAHELTKEREARIRVERSLTAAERARTEATALVESMRADTRRELEAGLRKREAETARRETEMQEQVDALTEKNGKAAAERDALAGRLEEKLQAADMERERLVARVAQLEAAGATAAVKPEAALQWESRAIANLESEIENYRARIKVLLQERGSSSKEREQSAGGIALPSEGAAGGCAPAQSELGIANEKLKADLQTAVDERDRLLEQLQTIEQRLDTLTQDREESAGELTRAKAELATRRAEIEELKGEREQARKAAELNAGELRSTIEKLASKQESLRQQSEIAGQELQARNDLLTRDLTSLRATENDLRTMVQELERERDEAGLRAETTLADLRAQIERLTFERDAAVKNSSLSTAELGAASEPQAIECERLRRANERLEMELANVAQNHAGQIAALEADVDRLRSEYRGELAALTAERDTAMQRLASRNIESDRTVETLQAERDRLLVETRETAAALHEAREARETERGALDRELEALIAQRDEAFAEIATERSAQEAKADALAQERLVLQETEAQLSVRFERETERLRRERDSLLHERDDLRERIAKVAAEHGQLLKEIANDSSSSSRGRRSDPSAKARGTKEAQVIDVTPAEGDVPLGRDSTIDLQRVRPVAIPPPQVRVL